MYCQKCGTEVSDAMKFCAKCGHEIGAPVVEPRMPASMGRRFVNNFLDLIFVRILLVVVFMPILFRDDFSDGNLAIMSILAAILGLLYYVVFETIWQRTPAKWITGTKVVMRDGSKPKFLRIVGRTLCRLIPLDAISFLYPSHPAGWHDQLSKTLVVPKSYSHEDVKKIDTLKFKSSKMVIIIAVFLGFFAMLGIIATIALTSLGSARTKAIEAKIMNSLAGSYEKGELYRTANNGSYKGFCVDPKGIAPDLEKMDTLVSEVDHPYKCGDSEGAWVVSVVLNNRTDDNVSDNAEFYCVDSAGTKTKTSDILKDGEYACPVK